MKNTHYKFNKFDLLSLCLFVILLIFTLILHGFYCEKVSQLNLNKIDCDYITIINSEEDSTKIKNNEYCEKVVPYYYFTTSINNKSTSNLYVIDDFDFAKFTTFSDKLLLKESKKIVSNGIYIDEIVSKKYNLSINDKVTLSFANTKIDYIVTKIFKSDMRNIDGSLMVELDEKTNKIISDYYNNIKEYKGAFVVSNNHSKIKEVFDYEYIDLSDLSEKRSIMFKNEITSSLIIFVIVAALTVAFVIGYPYIKNSLYIKKNLNIDFYSKFTIKNEIAMFNKYNFMYSMIVLIILFVTLFSPMIQELFYTYSLRGMIYSLVYLFFILIIFIGLLINVVITNNKIKKFYK